MKRQLIEMSQQYLIQCDNPNCDYVIPNPTKNPFEDTKKYIDMPCPVCGENLLTQQDYDDSMKILKQVIWINKWFSWLAYLFPKGKKRTINAHVHDGELKITDK